MNLLLAILVALIVIGVLLWAIQKVLSVSGIPEPFQTVVWVIAVCVAVFVFLQISGLYRLPGRF